MTQQILAVLEAHTRRPQATAEGVFEIMNPYLW